MIAPEVGAAALGTHDAGPTHERSGDRRAPNLTGAALGELFERLKGRFERVFRPDESGTFGHRVAQAFPIVAPDRPDLAVAFRADGRHGNVVRFVGHRERST